MTVPGFSIVRTLLAALAGLLLIVAGPVSAANGCNEGTAACADLGCDTPVNGGDGGDGVKACQHCAFSHAGHSLPAQPAASSLGFTQEGPDYLRPPLSRLLAASRDGPERPPRS